MKRLGFVLFVPIVLWMCADARAQCQGGGGGQARSGGGAAAASAASGGGELLTSPGSWAYDVMLAQVIQQQMAQRQYALAMQKQAERTEDLAARKYRAEHQRAEVAERRRRMREFLAGQSSPKPVPHAPVSLLSLNDR